ncbi:hypothetical protein CDHC03_1856 [Corynebacterium diphtheriae HC03]|nr:hypothetical protein CDHC03_1856 [Corynebacterium diphtheriae HC03]
MTTTSWKLLNEALVRSCSVPYEALRQLCDAPTDALLTADLDQRLRVNAALDALGSAAHQDVAGCTNTVLRRALLDLKRAAHHHDVRKVRALLAKATSAGVRLPAGVTAAADTVITAAENVLSSEQLHKVLMSSKKRERECLGKIARDWGVDSAVLAASVPAAKSIRKLSTDCELSAKQLARTHRTALGT